MPHPFASTLKSFKIAAGKRGLYYSLPALARQFPNIGRLPVSLRLMLESVLRNCDGQKVTAGHVQQLADWEPNAPRSQEIPFIVSRVLLHDFTGLPLLAELAAMRSAAQRLGCDPRRIEPQVPVDLVVDHSIRVEHYGTAHAIELNMKLEFARNRERYEFIKWAAQAFTRLAVVPPGFGIVHQVNLEYLARGVHKVNAGAKGDIYYPDTLVGTDSHTTMVNGIGTVAWGVGGIEAEAAMLGQPVYLLTPDVVGLELTGRLRSGVTATDLALTVTQVLCQHNVVGKCVEFFGEGARSLTLPERATVANMAPEYGATMGFFAVDEKTMDYFKETGRSRAEIETIEAYFKAQGLFGVPLHGDIDYTSVRKLDLGTVSPSLAGPLRPQDRIELGQVAAQFDAMFSKPVEEDGLDLSAEKLEKPLQTDLAPLQITHGDVLIAAITSCANTTNPSVMLAAGLLAKNAVQAGLTVAQHIKTSLAPGSRIVTEYLSQTGLLPYLEQLGFSLVGYGCTTCVGNSGELAPEIDAVIGENNLVCAAVLSGNRNFEAWIHPRIRANYLASPPLVVAYAIAGTVRTDLMTQPVGRGPGGKPVYLGDIWPSSLEIDALVKFTQHGQALSEHYARMGAAPGKLWGKVKGMTGPVYRWPDSTYIAEPPFFAEFAIKNGAARAYLTGATSTNGYQYATTVHQARILALLGDSVTTDHISPTGSIPDSSPAGHWLLAHGVAKADFNRYGARRGNHAVMVRGTFGNPCIKNLMLPVLTNGTREEGGFTLFQGPQGLGDKLTIFDAASRYQASSTPTVVFAGEKYGTGSSRDWAAKGTRLLGVRAVVARSFGRTHRSNLVSVGVLPFQFTGGDSWQRLGLSGTEVIDIIADPKLRPQSEAELVITSPEGRITTHALLLRIDSPMEADYYRAGGILPFMLGQLLRE